MPFCTRQVSIVFAPMIETDLWGIKSQDAYPTCLAKASKMPVRVVRANKKPRSSSSSGLFVIGGAHRSEQTRFVFGLLSDQ